MATAKQKKRLGKYKTGKKCMYIARLCDVNLDVLEELCTRSFAVNDRPLRS